MKYHEVEGKFTKLKTKLGLAREQSEEGSDDIREQFKKLSPDERMKILSPQLDIYVTATTKKSEVFPVISTVAAALVIVATLNQSLVPLTLVETKAILSIFLLLIPVTLHYYVIIMEKTAQNAIKIIQSYQTKGIYDELGQTTFLQQLSSDFPKIIIYIFYGIVFLILFRVWFG